MTAAVDPIAVRVARDCERQGLPIRITDPQVLGSIAKIMAGANDSKREKNERRRVHQTRPASRKDRVHVGPSS